MTAARLRTKTRIVPSPGSSSMTARKDPAREADDRRLADQGLDDDLLGHGELACRHHGHPRRVAPEPGADRLGRILGREIGASMGIVLRVLAV
jgi:hypothetical protein